MSKKTDQERAAGARQDAIARARERTRVWDRVIDMYEDWLTDSEIAASLGCHRRTVLRHRKDLGLAEYKPARCSS